MRAVVAFLTGITLFVGWLLAMNQIVDPFILEQSSYLNPLSTHDIFVGVGGMIIGELISYILDNKR